MRGGRRIRGLVCDERIARWSSSSDYGKISGDSQSGEIRSKCSLDRGWGFFYTIMPGKTRVFEVPLSAFFDLSTPGKYEITFSRGTDSRGAYGRGPDNVDVKSNTITITVLPAGSPQPTQQ